MTFIGHYKAIKPLYGEFLGRRLELLEYGYMHKLLQKSCDKQQLSYHSLDDNLESLKEKFSLHPDDIVLNTICFDQMDKYSKDESNDNFQTYLYIKDGKNYGWYSLNPNLHKINDCGMFLLTNDSTINYQIFNNCELSIFFTGDCKNKKHFYKSGYLSQAITENALKSNIGACSIGNFDHIGKMFLKQIDEEKSFLQGIFLGKISDEQIKALESTHGKIK